MYLVWTCFLAMSFPCILPWFKGLKGHYCRHNQYHSWGFCPQNPVTTQNPHLPIPWHWGLGFDIWIWGGRRSIRSIIMVFITVFQNIHMDYIYFFVQIKYYISLCDINHETSLIQPICYVKSLTHVFSDDVETFSFLIKPFFDSIKYFKCWHSKENLLSTLQEYVRKDYLLKVITLVRPNHFLQTIFGVHCLWDWLSNSLSHSPFGTFHYSLNTSVREEGKERKGEEVKFKTPNVISVLVSKLCW